MTTLTAEDIDDDDIKQLSAEAAESGDGLMVALCAVALASDLGEVAEFDEDQRGALERLGVIPEHIDADVRARRHCADAINNARAQES